MTTSEQLQSIGACADARQWANQYSNWSDIVTNCKRSDWLMWLDTNMNILDDREHRLMACYFVRNTPLADGRKVWDLLTDERSRNAVRVAERYARGNASEEERDAAWAAAGDAAMDSAGVAAMDAAVDAARDAARDAAGAAAGAAAWEAARDAAWAAARDAARDAQCKYMVKKYGKRIIATLNEKHPVS